MTTRIIFKSSTVFPALGLPGEVALEPGQSYSFLNDSRLLTVAGGSDKLMEIRETENHAEVRELFPREKQNSEVIIIENETKSGEALGMPDILNVTHTPEAR